MIFCDEPLLMSTLRSLAQQGSQALFDSGLAIDPLALSPGELDNVPLPTREGQQRLGITY